MPKTVGVALTRLSAPVMNLWLAVPPTAANGGHEDGAVVAQLGHVVGRGDNLVDPQPMLCLRRQLLLRPPPRRRAEVGSVAARRLEVDAESLRLAVRADRDQGQRERRGRGGAEYAGEHHQQTTNISVARGTQSCSSTVPSRQDQHIAAHTHCGATSAKAASRSRHQ